MPYVYYGDEIGMLGQKPDPEIREPFLCDYKGKAAEQTSWMEAVNSTDETVIPLSEQFDVHNSTYSYFKYWIALRNNHEILRTGGLESISLPESFLGYTRTSGERHWVIIHNLTGETQSLDLDLIKASHVIYSFDESMVEENNTISLPAYSSVVLD
jgi:alpha-amylase